MMVPGAIRLPLTNHFRCGSQVFGKTLVSKLFAAEAAGLLIIPNTQRVLTETRVKEIAAAQTRIFKQRGTFDFEGTLTTSNVDISKNGRVDVPPYSLDDGQHRYAAAKRIFTTTGRDVEMVLGNTTVSSKEEQTALMNRVNYAEPAPPLQAGTTRELQNGIERYFMEHWPEAVRDTRRVQRPNLSRQVLTFEIQRLVKKLTNRSLSFFLDLIEVANNWTKLSQPKWNENRKSKTSVEQYLQKCQEKGGIFLGMDPAVNGSYPWVDRLILDFKDGKKAPPARQERIQEASTKKRTIDKPTRVRTWNHWVGTNVGLTTCLICNDRTIDKSGDYHCAHVVAASRGGGVAISNLRPSCQMCNTSMGDSNMFEWMRERGFDMARVISPPCAMVAEAEPHDV